MEQIEIRPIQGRDELDACFDLWATVFPENRAFFQQRLDYDPNYTEETTWIAKVNGELAAAVQLFLYETSLDGCILKVGGIGNVATLPAYRGRSLTQLILQRQSMWMKRKGIDLSLLFTGINPFYEKVGWDTVLHTSYNLETSKALSFISAKKGMEPSYTIEPFEPHQLDQVNAIYESFSPLYFGPAIRTADYWEGQLNWLKEAPEEFQVALEEQQVVAYLRVKKGRDAGLEITEACYKPGHESACLALVEDVLLKKNEVKQLKAELPKSHALTSFFIEGGAECRDESYAMWKIMDLTALFTKLKEVFFKRLQAASLERNVGIPSPLLIQSGGQEVLLHLRHDSVEVQDPEEHLTYQGFYKRKPVELLSDLINGSPFEEPIIKTLFPNREAAFWKTDTF